MSLISCSHFPTCSGCHYIGEDLSTQRERKISHLEGLVRDISQDLLLSGLESPLSVGWLSAGPAYLRDRLDFVWESGHLGLYSHELSKIIDIQTCTQLSEPLADWYQEFRNFKWPIKKGSIRLRVGPQENKGTWLDFANEDIKFLLDEKILLKKLLTVSLVEMGQKRKMVKEVGEDLKLKDPEPHIWFESYYKNQKVPLFSYIGSFTQPSLKANKLILEVINKWTEESGYKKASEFGAGIGNLSLGLLGHVDRLRVFESDSLSIDCFKKTLDSAEVLQNKKQAIEFNTDDYQRKKSVDFESSEILLVNPPRSGLKGFIETLSNSVQKPNYLIYMSCNPETWHTDGLKLKEMGYKLRQVMVADQFPQTKHYEVLSQWSR